MAKGKDKSNDPPLDKVEDAKVDGWLKWDATTEYERKLVKGDPSSPSAETSKSLIAELSLCDVELVEDGGGDDEPKNNEVKEPSSPPAASPPPPPPPPPPGEGKKKGQPPPVPGRDKENKSSGKKDPTESTLKGQPAPTKSSTSHAPLPPKKKAKAKAKAKSKAPPSKPKASPAPEPSSLAGMGSSAPPPPPQPTSSPGVPPPPPPPSPSPASGAPPPISSSASVAPPPIPSSSEPSAASGAPPPIPSPSVRLAPPASTTPAPTDAVTLTTPPELPLLPPILDRKRGTPSTAQPPPPPPPPIPRLDDVPERVNTLEEDARALATLIERELALDPDSSRAARLHHEIGTLYELHLGQLPKAAEHYQAALEKEPEHRPSIRSARRLLLSLDRPREALPLFEAEVRLTGDPRQRAALLLAKGRVHEHTLKNLTDAREVYRSAFELDGQNVSILKAIERCDRRREAWQDLASTYELLSNVVDDDDAYKAALIASRALLAEVRQRDREEASNLYSSALSLDPRAPGALPALKRLSHGGGRWNDLVVMLRHELDLSTTSEARVMDLRSIARLCNEKLGDTTEAIASLEAAASEAPGNVEVLRDLVDLYATAKRHEALASALERQYRGTSEPNERLLIAHRLGQLFDTSLRDDSSARKWYEAALENDPCFKPVIDALGILHERSGDWNSLIKALLSQIAGSDDSEVRADAHNRVAQIYERELGATTEAADHYDKALGFSLDHVESFTSLSRLHAQEGRWRELAELYQRVVDSSPGEERAIAYLFKIGAVYEDHLEDPAGALHAFQRILELEPDHLGALQAAQRAAERSGKHDVLLQLIEREVKTEGRNKVKMALLCRAAAVCDVHLCDVDGAIQRLRQVLKLDAKHPTALSTLSRLFRRAGRWEDLLQNYQSELQQMPPGASRVRLITKMGELCETHMGREKEAIGYYKRALGIEPTHRPSFDALVRILMARDDHSELARLMEERLESLDEPSEVADLAVAAARLYEEHLENPALALASYARALKALPGYQPALDGRSRLLYAAGKWKQLADDLAQEAEASTEETRALNAKVEEGLIRAHRLGDRTTAATCFEWVLERCPDHCGALMALEELHLVSDDVEALTEAYRRQADMLTNAGARVAVLRELARLYESNDQIDDALEVHQRVLELEGQDIEALEALVSLSSDREEPEEAIRALSQLVTSIDDTAVNASHMTRLAALVEGQHDADVLGAYRAALALDPNSLVTTRGFSRTARRLADPGALQEAALREARTTGHVPTAVMLLEDSARLHLAQRDLEGAANDFEKALELDPGHVVVSKALKAVLLRIDQAERLVEQLSRAADMVSQPDRKAELYLDVAELYSQYLHKLPAAIATAKRALKAKPKHLGSLIRLARDLEAVERWQEAVETLSTIVGLADDDAVLIDAHLRLAAIVDDLLGEPDRAASSLKVVLAKEPENRVALFRTSRIEATRGNYDRALAYTQTLLNGAASDADRASTLLQIASIEGSRENHDAAGKALGDAVSIEGADGLAASYYQQMIESRTGDVDWESYLEAIRTHIDRASSSGAPVGSSYRAAAFVLGDHLDRPNEAVKALHRGLDKEPDNVDTRLYLARLLRQIGNYEQAVEELRELFGRDARIADSWREYALVKQAGNDAREVAAATQALKLLGAATPEELVSVMAHQPGALAVPQGFLSSPGLGDIHTDPAHRHITELVAALEPALAKLYPMDPGRYGLTKRDRIHVASVSPFRVVADDIAKLFDVGGFELYFHNQSTPDVSLELGKPPALFIPEWAGSLPRQSLVFLFSRLLINIARGAHVVYRVSTKELALLLAGATRNVVPSFRSGAGVEAEIEDRARALAKAVPRRSRKAVTAAAEQYARAPSDLERWVAEVYASADRAALLLSDDLSASIEVISRITGDTLERKGPAAKLLRFWASETAVRFRRASAS